MRLPRLSLTPAHLCRSPAAAQVFLTPTHLVLAMEYAAGGDLFKHVATRRSLPEEEARWFFQQLLVGVDYCHRMGVASRDIKLENTLLDGSPRPLIKVRALGARRGTGGWGRAVDCMSPWRSSAWGLPIGLDWSREAGG